MFIFGFYFCFFEAGPVEQADEVDITDIPINYPGLHGSSHVTRPDTLELEIDEELADTAPLLLSTSAGSNDSSLLQV